jgi:KipI family sensor histidine kinase inhibitor
VTPVELLRVGDRGWMVDLESARIPAVVESVRKQPWAVVLQDIVPAARSILFCAKRSANMTELATRLKCLLDQPDPQLVPTVERDVVVVPVRYDGDDLEDVAEALGCTVADVVEGHTSAEHRVGFFGFAPGFAYIDGLPDSLRLPRRASPRPRVGQGMVAIAGTQTVVYPGGTPGGWHLIGRTSEVLWDSTSDSPSRLSVGDRVVFRAVTE